MKTYNVGDSVVLPFVRWRNPKGVEQISNEPMELHVVIVRKETIKKEIRYFIGKKKNGYDPYFLTHDIIEYHNNEGSVSEDTGRNPKPTRER